MLLTAKEQVNAYTSYNEEDLLQLLHLGDEKAFTLIYNQYWDKLYFLAHKHLKSSVAAEEIVQDVFLTIWRKRSSIQIQSLTQYLAAMTRYAIYRHLAKEKKLPLVSDAATREYFNVANEQEALDNKLLLEIIKKLSNRLPEKCRLVFIRNKLLDQPLPQVARQLSISDKTAEAHLTKALKAIRNNIKKSLILFFTVY
ncbi:MAG: sigma-70 family RNA polymerase sigma factor [Chitinophagaceae bacterium]|nr:sigma-70 family RNA polymerase sigma factor [Chitinophagaceae bacterium]